MIDDLHFEATPSGLRVAFEFKGVQQTANPDHRALMTASYRLNGTQVNNAFRFDQFCNLQQRTEDSYTIPYSELQGTCPNEVSVVVTVGTFIVSTSQFIICSSTVIVESTSISGYQNGSGTICDPGCGGIGDPC